MVGEVRVAVSFSTKSPDLLSSVIRVISHASRHHSSVQAGSVRLCQPSTPRIPTCLSRDSHGSRVGPSWPAWRVISAITSFGPPLPWGLLETGQEEGLLPLSALTPSIDRRAIALPRPVASVTVPVASLSLAWKLSASLAWALGGASPSAPDKQALPHAV